MLGLHYNHPKFSDAELNGSIASMLDSVPMMSIATVHGKQSCISTAYFAYNDLLRIYFYTSPDSDAGRNIAQNPSVAAAVWQPPADWTSAQRNLQLFGTAMMTWGTGLREAVSRFHTRFPGFERMISSAAQVENGQSPFYFYVIRVKAIRLLDEAHFGRDRWLLLRPTLDERAA